MSIIDEFDFIDKKDINYKLVALVLFVILFALYVGNLLFGNKSVSQLLDLQHQKEILQKEVKKLEKDNSKKQKEYFELKELEDNK